VDEWVKMTITRFSVKRETKVVVKEKKELTLFIYKVESQECKFSAQNRMGNVKN
jgi:hypothetical protein